MRGNCNSLRGLGAVLRLLAPLFLAVVLLSACSDQVTRQVTRLTYNDALDQTPVWSPDGERIAFVSGGNLNSDIYVMNADGSGITRLTHNKADDLSDWSLSPAWSPDGERIAFYSGRDIYVMNADGSGITRLTHNGDSSPCPYMVARRRAHRVRLPPRRERGYLRDERRRRPKVRSCIG